MKITVIAVGKIKEKFYEQAVAEYQKRLSRYCRLEIIQVADEKTPDGASEIVENQIKEKEGTRILAQIKEGAYVIALAIEGEMLTSEGLAEKMEKLAVTGTSHIVFVIGGSLGLSGEVRGVSMAEQRVNEAAKLGFETCILPRICLGKLKKTGGIRLIGVGNVREAIDALG